MALYLPQEQKNLIVDILLRHKLEGDVWAFGSRVRGDHKKYSDLDLIVRRDEPLELQDLVRLKDEFESSSLPITVDIVEWSKIDDSFRNKIQDELLACRDF